MKAVSLARSLLFVSTIIALITLFSSAVRAWDDLDYEIFDLVDGIKKTSFPASIIPEAKASTTFYDILGVSASADDRELARAFKKLARTHHPDKNPSEETRVLYNTLDAIHKILRDPTKRERYNFFMRNGVPVWRDGRYYYSRWRPGFGTAATGLLVFVSGVQYLLAWVGYWRAQQSIRVVLGPVLAAVRAAGVSGSPSVTPTSSAAGAAGPSRTARRRAARLEAKASKGGQQEANVAEPAPVKVSDLAIANAAEALGIDAQTAEAALIKLEEQKALQSDEDGEYIPDSGRINPFVVRRPTLEKDALIVKLVAPVIAIVKSRKEVSTVKANDDAVEASKE